jgi:uncharacterized protein (TIGR02453 family)
MSFRGWPAEALSFYEGLEADNSKTYWQDNKEIYETTVRAPMDDLLAEIAEEFGDGKVFRPYRDVRFSADKSPYKTHLGAMVGGRGYVQLSASGLAAGCGAYVMAPDQLDRYRRAVADDRTGSALTGIVEKARAAGLDISGRDTLKTVPRGYPADHPRRDLLRHKGLVAWQEWPPGAWLGTRKAKDRVVTFLRSAAPLATWLEENVGASTADRHR